MGTRVKRNKLSLYLLKDSYDSEDRFLVNSSNMKIINLNDGIIVYYKQVPSNSPSWQKDFFLNKISELRSSSVSVVVKIPIK